jgi:hypothetical protein
MSSKKIGDEANLFEEEDLDQEIDGFGLDDGLDD